MKANKSKKSFVATMPHIANIDPFSSDSQVRVSSWQALSVHGVGREREWEWEWEREWERVWE